MVSKHPTYEQLIFSALSELYHQHHSPNVHINSLYNFFARNYVQVHQLSVRSWKSLVRKRIDAMASGKLILKLPNNYIRITSKRHFQGHTTQRARRRPIVLPSPPATSPIRPYTPPTSLKLSSSPQLSPQISTQLSTELSTHLSAFNEPAVDLQTVLKMLNNQKETLRRFKEEFLNSLTEDYSFHDDILALKGAMEKQAVSSVKCRDQELLISDLRLELNDLETKNESLRDQLNHQILLSKWQDSTILQLRTELSALQNQILNLYKFTNRE